MQGCPPPRPPLEGCFGRRRGGSGGWGGTPRCHGDGSNDVSIPRGFLSLCSAGASLSHFMTISLPALLVFGARCSMRLRGTPPRGPLAPLCSPGVRCWRGRGKMGQLATRPFKMTSDAREGKGRLNVRKILSRYSVL